MRAGLAALALTGLTGIAGNSAHAATPLVESGSSLLYPLFNIWVPVYSKNHPNVQITTTSTGSGAGIAESIKGLVQIGASDAYLSDAMAKDHPNMLSIPLAISAQMINYNLPGISHLHLSGPILAGIYTGKITKWNDPQIAAANPGVNLPDHTITPIRRIDGSGDTFIFTQYLSDSDPSWKSSVGYSTTISWPAVSGEIGAKGNQGMITAAQANQYSVAYIGISYADKTKAAGLGTAALKNASGNFVLPTQQNISDVASSMAPQTPKDERVSMIFTKGDSNYPIVNYEYAIVNSHQPNHKTAKELRHFLTWAINQGNDQQYLSQVNFVALPPSIKKLSAAQISKIK